MAVKTITIDMEAYELLSRSRTGDESFSKVIKHAFGPAGKNAESLLLSLNTLRVSSDYLEAMERVMTSRNDDLLAADTLPVYKG